MATPPVPQQPANLSFDQIRPLIALMNNKKGSLNTDISTLFDKQFGVMSNSYTQQSPEELLNMYAPQSMSLANSSDQTIMDILADFQNGKSPFEIKQAIRNGVNSGEIVSSDGEGQDYLDVVDVIFNEQQTVKTKLDEQNKIYRDAGIPTPEQRFDPQSYMPKAFSAIDEGVAANRPKVDAALAAIKSKYDMMDKNAKDRPVDTGDSDYINYLNNKNPNYMKNVQEGRRRNAAELAATAPPSGSYIDYLNEKNPDYQQQVINSRMERAAVKRGQRSGSSSGAKGSTANKTREQQIRDSNRQLEIERAGGKAKQLISANDPNQQAVYNPYDQEATAERMKQLISQRISQGLEQRGETPTNVALLQRFLLNQNSKG
jgi:hypothetical protein